MMHDAMLSHVRSDDLDLFTYDPFRGTKVCLRASQQRYIQHSRYQLDDEAHCQSLAVVSHSFSKSLTCYIILLPCQHDLWCTVIARGYIASHLRILDTGETKITNLQVAVFIDQNVAWFLSLQKDRVSGQPHDMHLSSHHVVTYQITMDDASRMHILETSLLNTQAMNEPRHVDK